MKCLSLMRITMTYGLTWIFGMIPVLLSDVLAIGLSVDQSAIDDRALSCHVVGIRICQELGEAGYVLRRLRPVECNALDILLGGRNCLIRCPSSPPWHWVDPLDRMRSVWSRMAASGRLTTVGGVSPCDPEPSLAWLNRARKSGRGRAALLLQGTIYL